MCFLEFLGIWMFKRLHIPRAGYGNIVIVIDMQVLSARDWQQIDTAIYCFWTLYPASCCLHVSGNVLDIHLIVVLLFVYEDYFMRMTSISSFITHSITAFV